LAENLKERDHLNDLGVDGRIMLNLQGVRVGLDSDEAGLSSSNGLL
jgi:hypothetical protein